MGDQNPLKPDPHRGRTDTRSKIIHAAADVFAVQGYARATTQKIADASGFTEMTLFRHFGSKDNLFAAVLEQYAVPENFEQLLRQTMQGSYRENLLLFGKYLLEVLIERRIAMQMMLCEASHFPDLQEVLGRAPARLRKAAASYFSQCIKKGELVDRDPELMAQVFIGFFFSYAIGSGILEASMKLELEKEQMIEEFVDLFVQGTVRAQDTAAKELQDG
ncbi:MAG: TetR/AcrR family transcriptional regulator [Anaerolineales bacterium]|nr:TetR/AcrR family transcriptional regulator [Anaerolineales bacterium]